MYVVHKTMEIAASHSLHFGAADIWEPLHGHNWIVRVWCCSPELDADGFVVDFTEIERRIHGRFDHGDLNSLLPCNPSTENFARWICDNVPHCFKVEVLEGAGAGAVYIAEGTPAEALLASISVPTE